MHVGMGVVRLRLPESSSLKDKRTLLRPLMDRVRRRFNVAVAEVDQLDDLRAAAIGLVCVSNDVRHANSVLSQAVTFIEDSGRDLELLDYQLEFITAF